MAPVRTLFLYLRTVPKLNAPAPSTVFPRLSQFLCELRSCAICTVSEPLENGLGGGSPLLLLPPPPFGDCSSGTGCSSLACSSPCWAFGRMSCWRDGSLGPSKTAANLLSQMKKLRHSRPAGHRQSYPLWHPDNPVFFEWDQAKPLPLDPAVPQV